MRQLKITHSMTRRESPSLEKYLQDIGKIDLLSPEQEADLAKRIKQGDQVALEQLTRANLRFVVSVAKQYQNQGLSLGDLINEGNVGLIKAAHRFDETRGFKFISYAVWSVRQRMLAAIAEYGKIVKRPGVKKRSIIEGYFMEFLDEYGYPPEGEELFDFIQHKTDSEEGELSFSEIQNYLSNIRKDASLDESLGGEDGDTTHLDMLIGANPRTEEHPIERINRETLRQIAQALFPQQENIMKSASNGTPVLDRKATKVNKYNKEVLFDVLCRLWGVGEYDAPETPDEIAQAYNKTKTTIDNYVSKIKLRVESLRRSKIQNPEAKALLKQLGIF